MFHQPVNVCAELGGTLLVNVLICVYICGCIIDVNLSISNCFLCGSISGANGFDKQVCLSGAPIAIGSHRSGANRCLYPASVNRVPSEQSAPMARPLAGRAVPIEPLCADQRDKIREPLRQHLITHCHRGN